MQNSNSPTPPPTLGSLTSGLLTRFTNSWAYIVIALIAVVTAVVELISIGAASISLFILAVMSVGFIVEKVAQRLDRNSDQ